MVEEERQELVSLQKCLEGIESNESDEQSGSDDQVGPVRHWKWMKWIAVTSMAFGSLYGFGKCFHQRLVNGTAINDVTRLYEMPQGAGVNLGGWLVLEDWFFSGSSGSFVMSQGVGQGQCLPPLLPHSDEPWPSEGVLAYHLNATKGKDQTVKIFEAHRREFLADDDLQKIAEKLGENSGEETALVPDPFYLDKIALATIPRKILVDFLHKASKHGLTVIFDLHAFPGGAQDGTYNTVWPNRPVFWNEKTQISKDPAAAVPLSTAGRWVVQALIKWVEALDPETQKAVRGLTLMNEPAHTNAWSHFAEEQNVLTWLSETSGDFRTSSLPAANVKLYVNLIETAFSAFEHSAVPWFLQTFTKEEQKTWAVADVHWYVAWSSGDCDGRSVEGGGFHCAAPMPQVKEKLHLCASSASQRLRHLFGDAQVSVTEFSAGTFHKARYACHDSQLLRAFIEEQVTSFQIMDKNVRRSSGNVKQGEKRSAVRWLPLRGIELGCGTGVAGFGLAFLGHQVLLTDIGAEQAAATQGNIAQNMQTLAATGGSAQYGHLDWRQLPERSQYGRFDLVLASDVIWHESLVEPFLQAVSWATSGPGAEEVILSHKARDQESIELFHKMLGPLGLALTSQVPSEQVLGEHGHPDVQLYHLRRVQAANK
eukprot:s1889_g6.t2